LNPVKSSLLTALALATLVGAAFPALSAESGSEVPLLRAERLRHQAMWCDLVLVLLRENTAFWKEWTQVDGLVEARLLQQHPEAASRMTFRDPGNHLLAAGWLLGELARNAEYLVMLGRVADAERVLSAAERLANAAVGRRDALDVLVGNTFSRFLLAGWRDSDDPLAALEIQVHNTVANQAAVRTALHFRASAFRSVLLPPAAVSCLIEAACSGRVAGFAPNFVLRHLAGLHRAALSLFPLASYPLPHAGPTVPGRHAAVTDDATLALNLPFSLVPVAAELEAFLKDAAGALPGGTALVLGAGDGGEALRLAALPGITSVIAVDHSALAVERMERLTQRLRHLRRSGRISPVLRDVREYGRDDGTLSLAVACHLVEYLGASDRIALYRSLVRWMMPGGRVLLLVHVDQGGKLSALASDYANVQSTRSDDGVRLEISSLVPACPAAEEVKEFPSPGTLTRELDLAGLGPTGGFERSLRLVDAAGGFVEAVVVGIADLGGRPD